jgi:hypothetical protein
LSMADKTELLRLLQLREQLEAERPIDTRPSLESFVNEARDQAAAESSDPKAYVTAWNSHLDAVWRYSARLAKQNVGAPGECPSLEKLSGEFREVVELARAEGCAPPWEIVEPPEPEALPPDPLEAMRRKAVPRSVLRDIEQTQTRTAEEHVYERIRAEQKGATTEPEQEDKLRWFRDQAPPGIPPSWPDS